MSQPDANPHRRHHEDLVRRATRHKATSLVYRRWQIKIYPLTTETAAGKKPIAEARPSDLSILPESHRDQWIGTRDAYDPRRGPSQIAYGLRQLLATIDHYADNPDALQAL